MFARILAINVCLAFDLALPGGAQPVKLDPVPRPLASDPSVKVDYDIVYVRAPRVSRNAAGKEVATAWPEFGHPTRIDPGYAKSRCDTS